MSDEQNIVSIGTDTVDGRFPGAVDFVETFDMDEDASEASDILSFDSLREAFATIHIVETELSETIPGIQNSAEEKTDDFECPDYGIADTIGHNIVKIESESDELYPNVVPPVAPRLETIVEAILFVGNRENRPLVAEQIAEKLRDVSSEDVDMAVAHLNKRYQERNYPYVIVFERGGYRMILRQEFKSISANFYGRVREARLSQQAIDTLAVVAYRQPITAEEIQTLRRQSCTSILNQLVRRNLLRISHEMRDQKKVACYRTTSRFLELFQIKSLDEIPKTDELD